MNFVTIWYWLRVAGALSATDRGALFSHSHSRLPACLLPCLSPRLNLFVSDWLYWFMFNAFLVNEFNLHYKIILQFTMRCFLLYVVSFWRKWRTFVWFLVCIAFLLHTFVRMHERSARECCRRRVECVCWRVWSVCACVRVCAILWVWVWVCLFVLRGWSLLIFEQTHTCKILVPCHGGSQCDGNDVARKFMIYFCKSMRIFGNLNFILKANLAKRGNIERS